jgi:hypothetical protein
MGAAHRITYFACEALGLASGEGCRRQDQYCQKAAELVDECFHANFSSSGFRPWIFPGLARDDDPIDYQIHAGLWSCPEHLLVPVLPTHDDGFRP